ncbi:MAG: UTP--glucose-1-phosphate uridylyltransferase [Spirochaetales bacterium]|jgi:UTP--glucose-1-phosphate uridylyltransferase|nr:UTP--glucose-1-phosphate uridylyltransferase [Spirochaetales bacterium]
MKGVIIAAGYGTRFLPATKTLPKEMLPLLDRPAIDIVVEEFIKSGIDEILIVTSRRKKALEDYFDREMELEKVFTEQGAADKLAKIKPYPAKFFFVRQQEMRGTGHALLHARPFLGSDPFVVAYPDDLHFGEVPLAKQLIELYNETGCTVLATIHDPPNLHSYAVPALDGAYVTDIEEKPAIGAEKSKEASIGRFLYNSKFLDCLEEAWEKFTGEGEFYHVEGLMKQISERKVVVRPLTGKRVDTGTPDGYIRALVHYVSQRPELLSVLKEAMAEIE